MAKKQKHEKQATENPEQAVETKVDKMMSLEVTKAGAEVEVSKKKKVKKTEPLDIFKNQGAPPLPDELKLDEPEVVIDATSGHTIQPVGVGKTEDPGSSSDELAAPLDGDTAQGNAAIEDIVTQEADEVLAAQDAGIQAANFDAERREVAEVQPKGHPLTWFVVFVLVVLIAIAAVVVMSPGLTPSFNL
jgi:hypothetical protein